jgi:phage terminase large subunit-like protein
MAKFSQDYISFMDDPEKGFLISNAWDIDTGKELGIANLKLTERQRRISNLILTQDENGKFPYQTVVLSDIKKSGKTAWAASIIAWFAETCPPDTDIIICANSLDQSARLVYGDISFHYKHTLRAKVLKDIIELPNGTKIYTISKNYTSAAGSRHALTVFDEAWGMTSEDDRRKWDELTPIPTISHSLRMVTTYAGFYGESELLWDLYVRGVDEEEHQDGQGHKVKGFEDISCYENGKLFVYWNHEPHMPWQTPEYYAEQLASERPNAYLRLHENRWTSSREIFIPIEWWDEAAKHLQQSAELWSDHPYAKKDVYVAIDAATKRDCCAIIGVSPDTTSGKIAIVFHQKWTPPGDGESLDLEQTLEPYLLQMYKRFHIVDIACDPAHMYQIITRMKNKGLPINEFSQVDSGMIQASQHLYDLLRQDNLWAYPADDIRDHMQNVMAEYTNRGLKIVKDKGNPRLAKKKVDLIVALAMACHRAYEHVGEEAGEPIIIESHLARMSAWGKINTEPAWMPEALRSD